MRLEDCIVDIDAVGIAPLHRSAPEECWVEARDSRAIPLSVFTLYAKANFLSLDTAPRFLADQDRLLSTYFRILLSCLRGSLVESDDELAKFLSVQERRYDPWRIARGGQWHPKADDESRRHFKHILFALQSALDVLADLVGLFFTGQIKNLRVGRAQFSCIESWLESPVPSCDVIITPQQHFLQELRNTLSPLVYPDSPVREWLRLMRLYRNKAAHLGSEMFRCVMLHEKDGPFYTFLPRQWPYIYEKHIQTRGGGTAPPMEPFQQVLVHQDMISYMVGLRAKVNDVVAAAASVLVLAYDQLKDCPLNSTALEELGRNTEIHNFERFNNASAMDAE